jgi:hypothetical protein
VSMLLALGVCALGLLTLALTAPSGALAHHPVTLGSAVRPGRAGDVSSKRPPVAADTLVCVPPVSTRWLQRQARTDTAGLDESTLGRAEADRQRYGGRVAWLSKHGCR